MRFSDIQGVAWLELYKTKVRDEEEEDVDGDWWRFPKTRFFVRRSKGQQKRNVFLVSVLLIPFSWGGVEKLHVQNRGSKGCRKKKHAKAWAEEEGRPSKRCGLVASWKTSAKKMRRKSEQFKPWVLEWDFMPVDFVAFCFHVHPLSLT